MGQKNNQYNDFCKSLSDYLLIFIWLGIRYLYLLHFLHDLG